MSENETKEKNEEELIKDEEEISEKEEISEEEEINEIEKDLKSIEEERDQLVEEELIIPEEEKIPRIMPLKVKEEEEEVIEERFYTIPLGRITLAPRYKRSKRAIKLIREYLIRHFKPEFLKLEPELNEYIWKRGIQKPPRRVKVRATKDRYGVVTAYLVK